MSDTEGAAGPTPLCLYTATAKLTGLHGRCEPYTVAEIYNTRASHAPFVIRVQRITQQVNMQNIEVQPFEVLLEPPWRLRYTYCKNLTAMKKSDTPQNSFKTYF